MYNTVLTTKSFVILIMESTFDVPVVSTSVISIYSTNKKHGFDLC